MGINQSSRFIQNQTMPRGGRRQGAGRPNGSKTRSEPTRRLYEGPDTQFVDYPVKYELSENVIYFISPHGEPDVVKIGKSSDLHKRLSHLQTAHHRTLLVVASICLPEAAEVWIHELLKEERIRGEWFHRSNKVNRLIELAQDGDWEAFLFHLHDSLFPKVDGWQERANSSDLPSF